MSTEKTPARRAKSSTVRLSTAVDATEAAQPKPVQNSIVSRAPAFIDPERRCAMIAEAAYYRAEHRSFECGHDIEDWLAAEREIDGMLTRGELPLACGV